MGCKQTGPYLCPSKLILSEIRCEVHANSTSLTFQAGDWQVTLAGVKICTRESPLGCHSWPSVGSQSEYTSSPQTSRGHYGTYILGGRLFLLSSSLLHLADFSRNYSLINKNLFGQLCATCPFLVVASSWDKRVALPQWSGVWWLSLAQLEAQIGLCAEAIPVYLKLMVQSSIQRGAAGLLLY